MFTVVVPAKEDIELTKEKDSIYIFFNYVIALIKNHWKDLEGFLRVFLQMTIILFSIRTSVVITILRQLYFTP